MKYVLPMFLLQFTITKSSTTLFKYLLFSQNVVDDLSTKICAPSETKVVNVKVFNIITGVTEVKTLVKHISCDCKCKFNSTTCNSNQRWNND